MRQSNYQLSNGLSMNPKRIEKILREALAEKYGEEYVELMLCEWKIHVCDPERIIIQTNSQFRCEVIQTRLLPEIATIIEAVYGIRPVISIMCKE